MALRKRSTGASHDAFLKDVYTRLLGRSPDPVGAAEYTRQLDVGRDRADIALEIADSQEHRDYVLRVASPRRREPERYRMAVTTAGNDACWVFDVHTDDDFDWLEDTIVRDRYYERPGIWSWEIDHDKRVMAEVIAQFAPAKALELGCASGAVLSALRDLGIVADGVDISATAREHAPADIRDHIFVGDVLDSGALGLAPPYDMVFGLDIFEHLNPNRLGPTLRALRALLDDHGWLFSVIPAFGKDAVFGEVFPLYLPEWDDDVAAGRPFRTLHTDDAGYPVNGHLIWATTEWWVEQFERAGFQRRTDVEVALQDRFHAHFEAEPARRSCYVFAAGDAVDAEAVIERLRVGRG